MSKQQTVFTKHFNPYDLNEVAEVNNPEKQRPVFRQPCKDKTNDHNNSGKLRGLLKEEDEEKK